MTNRVGQKVGNYQILSLLGKGGFSEVYLGEHIYLKNKAALKFLHARLSDEDLIHFQEEGRLLASLVHPHIVRVLDFGLDDNIPFLVLDHAPNGSLRRRHPRGSIIPLNTVVSYVQQLADALQYAHDQKVIHRDIKPENMLLGPRHEVLLSDFGIALIGQSTRSQGLQEIAGTAVYMAPEQFQGM
ncbi:MAG TPA: serine/threonine-protein kinase, partial [Ktedonosporobacter sp.]|nr:serine/threonine-protein kinase [Ktedonosporobacter sp.]